MNKIENSVESENKNMAIVKRKRHIRKEPKHHKILSILKLLQKNDERILKQMAKSRVELGTQLTALAQAIQDLLDKIIAAGGVSGDFQAEFDALQSSIDSLNTAAAGL